ncbi:MAG TPA: M48 family metalloprotease [Thermoanaerobaculia bacterium]|nr:M48 family metalloprotease [Thermoanaerobaculia bacterium]
MRTLVFSLAFCGVAACAAAAPGRVAPAGAATPALGFAAIEHEGAPGVLDRDEIVRRYGAADPQHALVRRAHRVFARVREAAQPRAAVPAELVVVAGPQRPEALVLSDRTVVVNVAALELCYGPAAPASGDARLAFVLAHELAHLHANDFWHIAAFASIERNELLEQLTRETLEERIRREWNADSRGLEFTLIAGYGVDGLVSGDRDFFVQWDERLRRLGQVSTELDIPPEKRTLAILEQLQDLARNFDDFRLGTLLYAVGRYDDAIRLLERFERRHAGTEVRTNLGLAHFQAAARTLARCDGRLVERFRLPTRLAASTLKRRAILRGAEESPCYRNDRFAEHVARGRAALQAAADHDPNDIASRIDLISLHLLARQSAHAVAPANELVGLSASDRRPLAPDDPDARVAAALALYEFGRDNGVEYADRALAHLERALAVEPRHADALFDQGALLMELEREQEARPALRAFLEVESTGPWAARARQLLGLPRSEPEAPVPSPRPGPPSPVPLGGPAPRELTPAPGVQRVGNLLVHLVEGRVELALQPRAGDAPPLRSREIEEAYGTPRERLRTTLGAIWLYPGYGFELVGDEVVSTFFFVEG